MSAAVALTGAARLAGLISRAAQGGAGVERCEMCSVALAEEHRHLLDLDSGELCCSCQACSVLFLTEGAGDGRYRTVPQRYLRLVGLDLGAGGSPLAPVGLYFVRCLPDGRAIGSYPSPAGPTEAEVEAEDWAALVAANPVLSQLHRGVEVLLARRMAGREGQWLAPLDAAYELVGIVRSRWRGMGGGGDVAAELEAFFDRVDHRSRPCGPDGRALPKQSTKESR